MKESIISLIAKNCEFRKTVNEKYMPVCEERLDKLEEMLPNGSGIDAGCKIDREKSGEDRVVITFSFHHLNEHGYYCGWTDHELWVKPKLWNVFDMRIIGENRDSIKEYLYDLFSEALMEKVDEKTLKR